MSDSPEYLPSRKSTRKKSNHDDDYKKKRNLYVLIAGIVVVALLVAALVSVLSGDGNSRIATLFTRGGDASQTLGSTQVEYDEDGNPIPGTGTTGPDGIPATTADGSGIGEFKKPDGTVVPPTVLPADVVPHDWINSFYADLMSAQWERALSRLPASIRANLTAEQLQTRTEQNPIVTVDSESSPVASNETSAHVISTISYQDGSKSVQTWLFEKSGSNWIIVGRTIDGMPG